MPEPSAAHRGRPALPIRTLAAMLLAVGFLTLTWPAHAAPASDTGIRLLTPVAGPAYAGIGGHGYLFGGVGHGDPTDLVQVVDPAGGTASTTGNPLPTPITDAAAVVVHGSAFILGGHDGNTPVDTILRFDPATGTASPVGAALPTAVLGAAAVFANGNVYVIGGDDYAPNDRPFTDTYRGIVRYNLSSDEITLIPAELPTEMQGHAAVWHDGRILVLGGQQAGQTGPQRSVLSIDPVTGTVATEEWQLPRAVSHAAATWSGDEVLLVGGQGTTGWLRSIMAIDPETGTGRDLDAELPAINTRMAAFTVHGVPYATAGANLPTADRVVRLDRVNQAPVATFTTNTIELQLQLNASASRDPEGQPLSFNWTFGDGAVATGPRPVHTYAAAGTYVVSLTVTDPVGATAASVQTVTVTAPPPPPAPPAPPPPPPPPPTVDNGPIAAANSSAAPVDVASSLSLNGLRVRADATEALDARPGWNASWAWGDGSQDTRATGATHDYSRPGTFVLGLTLTSPDGAVERFDHAIELTRPTRYEGRVTGANGEAFAGTPVFLMAETTSELGEPADRFTVVDATTTDDDGRFALDGAPGATHLAVLANERMVVRPLPPTFRADLALEAAAGDPVDPALTAGVRDAVQEVHVLPLEQTGPSTRRASLGGFAGLRSVEVDVPGAPPGTRLVVASLGERGPARFPIPPGVAHGWFVLDLVAPDGTPVEAAQATITFTLPAGALDAGPPGLGHFLSAERAWTVVSAERQADDTLVAEVDGLSLFTRSTLPPSLLTVTAEAMVGPWGLALAMGMALLVAVPLMRSRAGDRSGVGRARDLAGAGGDGRVAVPEAALVSQLRVRHGAHDALAGISASVPKGHLTALVGASGAGKSTLLRVLAGEQAHDGTVRVLDLDVRRHRGTLRRRVGLVPQGLQLYTELTVRENVRFFGQNLGIVGAELRERTDRVLGTVGLTDRADQRVGRLSGGEQRRASLAATLVGEPEVLLLDEPTSGLDPTNRRAVWRYLRDFNRTLGVTVLVTTHFLDEAELADDVIILHHGRVIARGEPQALLRDLPGGGRVVVGDVGPLSTGVHDRLERALGRLVATGRVHGAELVGPRVRVFSDTPDQATHALRATLERLDVPVRRVEVRPSTMEDVFVHHTGEDWEEDPNGASTLTKDGTTRSTTNGATTEAAP